MKRKIDLVDGETYHIFVRSIAGFVVFNQNDDYERMIDLLRYYQINNDVRFSEFCEQKWVQREGFNHSFETVATKQPKIVQIIGFCIMPTHLHLILKQLTNKGISDYMRKVLNSYSSFFNIKHHRKGPLWESKFNNVLVESDEQLLHLTRYLYLNPVTAGIVKKPDLWQYSSYREYLGQIKDYPLCQFKELMDIKPKQYKKFVLDQIDYQKELSKIKHLLIDEHL